MSINIYRKLSPAKTTEVFDSYWIFAAKRQDVFFERIKQQSAIRSSDPILQRFRFTNTYRASDRVSQYLIKNVIYNNKFSTDPTETLFRILLFKLFNKIETWELLSSYLGDISYKDYDFKAYDLILNTAMEVSLIHI